MGIDRIETGVEDCLAREEDGIAIITLNRPQARNAMSSEMTVGLARALEYAERTASVRCVVVTGAGGAFCAGGDVKGMAARGEGGGAGPSLDERIHLQRLNQRETGGPHPSDAETRDREPTRPGRGRGTVARAFRRSAHHGRHRVHHHRVCAGWIFRRLRRQLLLVPTRRSR